MHQRDIKRERGGGEEIMVEGFDNAWEVMAASDIYAIYYDILIESPSSSTMALVRKVYETFKLSSMTPINYMHYVFTLFSY